MKLHVVRAQDSFDSLIKERESEQKQIEVAPNSPLEEAVKGFEKLLKVVDKEGIRGFMGQFSEEHSLSKGLAPLTIDERQLYELIVLGKAYEEHGNFSSLFGSYVNTLIARCDSNVLSLNLAFFQKPLDYIGYQIENKEIVISGNVGNDVGRMMRDSRMRINGDAGHDLGYQMKNSSIDVYGNVGNSAGAEAREGSIHIHGNAFSRLGERLQRDFTIIVDGDADSVGTNMTSGIIRVLGNAGDCIGLGMEGGEIHIQGEIKGLPDKIYGGRIYHKGKLIVQDGKKLK